MILTRIAVRQPVFATMVMVAIVIIGLVSYSRLAIDELPEVDFPVVAVVTSYPGATPEAVENDIIEPIENSVATLSGIDTITSTAQTGSSLVLIIFDLEVDSATAAQEVRDRVSQVQGVLPENADDPRILRFDPTETPILSIGLSSETLGAGTLTKLAEDEISIRISNISGVGQATVVGGLPNEVQVMLDPDRMTALASGRQKSPASCAPKTPTCPQAT